MTELTEKEWKEHETYESFITIMGFLGIDLTKWYFVECDISKHFDKVTDNLYVIYDSKKVEDVALYMELMKQGNTWVIEKVGMDMD